MDKPLLCIAIPSKNEKFLDNTIMDVLKNATGNIKIYPILDGYDCPRIDDPRVEYIVLPTTGIMKKRHGINKMVEMCEGEYVMTLDAHCSVAEGFDEQLIKDCQPNWVLVPQRRRLDAENWCEQDQGGRPPIDYEYFMWPSFHKDKELHGYKWDSRTLEQKDVMIDRTAEFQGSCWFMTKDWFNKCGFMQTEGYMGWGSEAEEVCLKTRQMGGEVMTDKNTSYQHCHKGQKYGRMYHLNRSEAKASCAYTYQHWVIDNKEFFIDYINSFPLMPNWPKNWVELTYGDTK
jgi:hypothetical protein